MYRWAVVFIFLLYSFSDTSLKITGIVINEKTKAPLIGCSVYNVTKQTGTITNEEGRFALIIEKGDVVQFTYIGMIPEEKTIVEGGDWEIEMRYMVRRMRDVIISGNNPLKNSVLYNRDYEKTRRPKFLPRKIESYEDHLNPLNIIQAPWDYLYYSSKRVQRKLTAIQDMYRMDLSNMKYSLEFISMITSVDDEAELKDIKAHCYFSHDLVLRSTYYELGLMLKECYVGYLLAKNERDTLRKNAKDSIPSDK